MPDQPADTTVTEQDSTVEPEETTEVEPEPEQEPEPDTFPRSVVEELRAENAGHRVKAKRVDDLSARLHTLMVQGTGRLADASDLAFDEAHIDDADAMNAAITELLERKPHLASRKPRGEIGQGATTSTGTVDLAELLRARA